MKFAKLIFGKIFTQNNDKIQNSFLSKIMFLFYYLESNLFLPICIFLYPRKHQNHKENLISYSSLYNTDTSYNSFYIVVAANINSSDTLKISSQFGMKQTNQVFDHQTDVRRP